MRLTGLCLAVLSFYFNEAQLRSGDSSSPAAGTEECCSKKVVTGTDGFDGTYIKKSFDDDKNQNCFDGCIYQREDREGEEYCFKAVSSGAADITDECQAIETPPEIPPVSTTVRVLYEENGEIIEQEDSFNNVTGEARLVVPAHGNNSAIEVVMQGSSMVKADNNFCQLSSVPDNIEPASLEANADVVSNSTADSTITKDSEDIVYGLELNEGDLSEEETENLSPSMKEACGGKPIVKMTVQKTDKDQFTEMAEGGIINIPQSRANINRLKRQTGCTDVKRLCTSNDRSCWRWPYSESSISIHNLRLNTLCVSCCEDSSDSELCQCSEITNKQTLSSCYAKSEGQCALGTYKCGEECLSYDRQCNGTCYGNNVPCGDECISKNHGKFSKQNCTTDGVTRCISINSMCNGQCLEGTFKCGSQCKPTFLDYYYRNCGDKCISIYTPCNGSCPEGFFSCGNRCIRDSSRSWYRECDGSCLYISVPCNGNCPEDTEKCGNNRCLPPWQQGRYRVCGDQCINKYSQCNGTCTEGYSTCGKYRCIRNDSIDKYFNCGDRCFWKSSYTDYYYRPCGDRCLYRNQFEDFYECKGLCIGSSILCTEGSSEPATTLGGSSEPATTLGGSSEPATTLGGSSEPETSPGGSSEPATTIGGSSEPETTLGGSSEPETSAGGSSTPTMSTVKSNGRRRGFGQIRH